MAATGLKVASRSVSRILYLSRSRGDDHLSGATVTGDLDAAHPQTSSGQLVCAGTEVPSWPCSGRGLPSRRCRHRRWWSLTPPFHPYQPRLAVYFLLHVPAGHPGWVLPTVLPCGVRTFLDCSQRISRGRPTDSPPPVYGYPASPRLRQVSAPRSRPWSAPTPFVPWQTGSRRSVPPPRRCRRR